MMAFYSDIWRNRDLIKFMVDGQQRAAVVKSVLGWLWHVLVPLSQAAIYFFLVAIVFSAGGARGDLTFITIVMGILHYALLYHMSSFVQPAIYGNASLLLQIKIEPAVLIAAGFFRSIRIWFNGIVVFFCFFFVLGESFTLKAMFYPLILLLFILLTWMIGLLVATAGVFLRDLERLLPVILQLTMYASPVIYIVDFYPEQFTYLLLFNPIASVFALLQWSLLGAEIDVLYSVSVVLIWIFAGGVVSHAFYRWGRTRFTKVF